MRRLTGKTQRIGVLAFLLVAGCTRCVEKPAVVASDWRVLREGLRYAEFKYEGARFHVVRADLNRFLLRIADGRKAPRGNESVASFARETNAVVAVNGNFFDEAHKPLGWMVSDGKQLNPIHDTTWWAALAVHDEEGKPVAEVLPTEALKTLPVSARAAMQFAIQVGPRTVVDGAPVKLKSQRAARTAVCVIQPQEVLLLTTEGDVGSNALAALMARPEEKGGLGCQQGMMLDGGPSTQMAIRAPTFTLDVIGGWDVPDAVVVVPR